ncbi:MAG TPA: glycine betaine ABC transporter substrate-binding protein [Gaiellaceae bacterium]|nr:glycine betaine ABC transporter substrate-binding protein [Gaiellaceae bacterium]
MVRKHTRRAAKAAFAISLGVALLIGILAAGAGAARKTAKPTVVIGTKNFTEEYILGQIYGQALAAKGFHVVYKGSFGSSELANTAIDSGKMNFYPEYTGIIALDLAQKPSVHESFPNTAAATYAAAKAYEQKHGLTLLGATPFVDSDTVTMLAATANKNHLTKISDLSKLKSFTYAGYPECKTRVTCLVGLKQVYGLKNVKFVSLGSISVYTLLDKGQITSGDGFTTDPQQNSKKYTTLVDDKHIFGYEQVAPVVSQKLLKGSAGMQLEAICNKVSKLLTLKAMRAMDAAAYSQAGTPTQIAHGFLKANGMA